MMQWYLFTFLPGHFYWDQPKSLSMAKVEFYQNCILYKLYIRDRKEQGRIIVTSHPTGKDIK